MSSTFLTVIAVLAGVFTVGLGIVHVWIPRLVGYRAGLAVDGRLAAGPERSPATARIALGRRGYDVRPRDLLGLAWVMSNAASFVLISIGALDLAWAAGWRGIPVGLGATWIGLWWAIRAAGQLALGQRAGDLAVLALFGVLAVGHVVLAAFGS